MVTGVRVRRGRFIGSGSGEDGDRCAVVALLASRSGAAGRGGEVDAGAIGADGAEHGGERGGDDCSVGEQFAGLRDLAGGVLGERGLQGGDPDARPADGAVAGADAGGCGEAAPAAEAVTLTGVLVVSHALNIPLR